MSRAVGLFASAVAVILCVTVAPEPPGGLCDATAAGGVGNIALFIPLGAAATLLGLGPWRAMAVGLALSGAIELLQLGAIDGRCASMLDVATNAAGALLGAWVAPRLTLSPRLARRLTIAGLVAIPLVWLVTARLQQPYAPAGAGVLRLSEDADGLRVTAVRADGVALAPGPVPAWGTLRQRLLARRVTIDFALRGTGAGAAPRRLAQLGRDRAEPSVMLEARRDTLMLRLNTPGELLGLIRARVALPGALPLRSDSAAAGLTLAQGAMRFALVDGAAVRYGVRHTDANWGWEWLTPLRITGPVAALWATVAWLGTVFGTLGFLARRAADGASLRLLWVAGAVLVAALAVAPALAGLEPTTPAEWLAAVTALAWGAGLAGRG